MQNWLVEQCPAAETYYQIVQAVGAQDWLSVISLCDKQSQVTMIADSKSRLPIHLALVMGAPMKVLQHLADAYKVTQEIVDGERERRQLMVTRGQLRMGAIEQSIERVASGRNLDKESETYGGDRKILQTLLELGRLNAREMQQVLRLDLSDVDDHIFFWKGDNVRAALAAVVTGSGFAEVGRRAALSQ